MSEPTMRQAEPSAAAGSLMAASSGQAPAEIVRMLTQDDLPYDDGDWSERTANLRMPTQDDLPYDDGEPMESERHLYQMMLLIETLKLHWKGRDDFFVGGNMFVYFSAEHLKNKDFRGPDFFVVMGVDGRLERKSWVVWEEGKGPDLVIEFLSDTTAEFDREGKKQIYHDQLRVPEYFYYDPFSGELAGFGRNGSEYNPREPDERGRQISNVAGLALARWEGEYMDLTAGWLRWETLDGKLLPTKDEVAQQAQQLAEQERARAERLADKLRELGVDPATLG